MSKHFTRKEEVERTTRLSYLFSPLRPLTPGEVRFRYHGYVRGAFVMSLLLYFVYCNPEYSYTYSALRTRYGWDKDPPMLPQYLKIQSPVTPDSQPPSPPQQK